MRNQILSSNGSLAALSSENTFPLNAIEVPPQVQSEIQEILAELRSDELDNLRLEVIRQGFLPEILDVLDREIFVPVALKHKSDFPGRNFALVRQHIRFGVGKAIEGWEPGVSGYENLNLDGESDFDLLLRLSSHIAAFGTTPLTDESFEKGSDPHGAREVQEIISHLTKHDVELAFSFLRYYMEGKDIHTIAHQDFKTPKLVRQELDEARRLIQEQLLHVLEYEDEHESNLSELAFPSGTRVSLDESEEEQDDFHALCFSPDSTDKEDSVLVISEKKPRPGTKIETALKALVAAIESSQRDGTPIPTRAKMAEEAGVTRETVEAALKYLTPEARALLPGRGRRSKSSLRSEVLLEKEDRLPQSTPDIARFLKEVAGASPSIGFQQACPILQDLRADRIETLLDIFQFSRVREESRLLLVVPTSAEDFDPEAQIETHLSMLEGVSKIIRDFQAKVPYAQRHARRNELTERVDTELGVAKAREKKSVFEPHHIDKLWRFYEDLNTKEVVLRDKVRELLLGERLQGGLSDLLREHITDIPSACGYLEKLRKSGVPFPSLREVRMLLEEAIDSFGHIGKEPDVTWYVRAEKILGEDDTRGLVRVVRDQLRADWVADTLIEEREDGLRTKNPRALREALVTLAAFYIKNGITPGSLEEVRKRIDPVRQDIEDKEAPIIKGHLRFVLSVASKFSSRSFDLRDKTAFGVPGLLKALRYFQAERGLFFTTYATHWVKQSVRKAVQSSDSPIRIPSQLRVGNKKEWAEYHSAIYKLRGGGIPLSVENLCKQLGWPQTKVERFHLLADAKRRVRILSVDRMFDGAGSDGDTDPWAMLEDFGVPSGRTSDSDAPDFSKTELFAAKGEERETLEHLINELPSRTQVIMRMRFGLDPSAPGREFTLDEVGKRVGVTRERVRQIQRRGVEKLRLKVRAKGMKEESFFN
ncbi:MAG: sigma-70 family RNA polymerase sigma factor [Bdellovibrionales bacterium]|nr:sigma-70 family RNA polymerase sigma factor [Bdellovibrionales bacterium]